MQNNRGERLYARLCFRSEAEACELWDSALWSELEDQIGSRCRKRDGASWVIGFLPSHGIDPDSVFRTLLARLPISRVTSITEAQFDASRSSAAGSRDQKFYFGPWLAQHEIRPNARHRGIYLEDTYFVVTSSRRLSRGLTWLAGWVMGLKLWFGRRWTQRHR